jgi:NAD(P)-dependent dehydrogenase (short-subunit alcohol dehydrogenase family)
MDDFVSSDTENGRSGLNQLENKIALITGGTSGIGAAAAKRFRQEGASVIVTSASPASLEAAQGEMAGVEVLVSDAGDPAAAKSLVEHVVKSCGRIDILFVNAGISRLTPIEHADESLFDKIISVNFRGPYFLLMHAAPVISEDGSIILTSSTSAVQGIAGVSAYSASKAALRSLGTTLAVELAPRRIRVNTISPGFINTPMGGKIGLTPEQFANFGQIIAKAPLGRLGDPDEVAGAALYFASDESRFTTGTELRIDGGLTLV